MKGGRDQLDEQEERLAQMCFLKEGVPSTVLDAVWKAEERKRWLENKNFKFIGR